MNHGKDTQRQGIVWITSNNKSKLSYLKQEDGSLSQDDGTKAELFNTFFSSVFTNKNMDSMPILDPQHNGITLSDIIILPDTRTQTERDIYIYIFLTSDSINLIV